MQLRNAAVATLGLLLLTLMMGMPARAAPSMSTLGLGTAGVEREGPVVEANYRRRCWRHRGRWVCRRHHGHYGYSGTVPFLGLYFGGGGHRGWNGGGRHHNHGHHGHRGHRGRH